MWESDQLTPIPSTRKPFYITSNRGHYFFIKPGKSFILDKKWEKITETAQINNKIGRFITSPLGKAAIHIPNSGTYVAIHENRLRQRLTLIPIPIISGGYTDEYIKSAYLASGESVLVTRPFESLSNAPSKGVSCLSDIRGIAVSDTGHMFAIAVGAHFWIWQQIEDSPRGFGFWTDLTSDTRFGTNIMGNQPVAVDPNNYHGFMRPRQTFALHPAVTPQMPANCAVAYQDLALFDNPDEGKGVISVTTLLPPSKPFDTLYIFSSVCKFNHGNKPTFERYSASLPIYEGGAAPCIWWSSCCRTAVIAVSNSIVIITRSLHIIACIPIEKVLPLGDLRVASVAWSACGQYFIVTSMKGAISALTRGGKSMKHQLCGLKPFGGTPNVPLMAVGDSYDPGLFIIFNKKVMRPLRIDTNSISHPLNVILSLPFPLGSAAPMYPNVIEAINSNDYTDKQKLAELLFYTHVYQIFPNYSPLRYALTTVIDDAAIKIYESGDDLFSLLLLRCVLWITDHELPTYQPILERLGYTKAARERHIKYLLQYELERKDYVEARRNDIDIIKMYDGCGCEEEDEREYQKPDDGQEANLQEVINAVNGTMFSDEKRAYLEVDANLKPLFDYLIFAGRFEQASNIAVHPSISLETTELFEEFARKIGDNVPKLYKAMVSCIANNPEQENQFRASCVAQICKIMRKMIIETMPDEQGKVNKLSSLIDVEEQFELVCPDDETQCNDFAVIASIAIAAAEYKNVTNFLKRQSDLVPDLLLEPIREVFRLIWFVHYRESAINDLRLDQAHDSCLRLLGFPDFMNISIVEDHVRNYSPSNYSSDIYAHYLSGNRKFDQDPDFIDAAESWLSNMSPRALKRVIDAIECFTKDQDEVPHSKLLFAMVVSQILPYLRCALARSLTGFNPGGDLPSELTGFEDFGIPLTEDHNMTIEKFVPEEVNEISEISAGEFHPQNVPSETSSQHKRRRKKRRHRPRRQPEYDEEEEIRVRKKKPIRRVESSDSDDLGITLTPLLINKKGRHRAPASFDFDYPQQQYYYPPQQDFFEDPNAYQFVTPGYMPQMPDIIHGYAETGPEAAFAPIWDIDPSEFVKKEEPVKEEKVKEEKEVQPRYSTKSVSCDMEPVQEPVEEEIPVREEPPKRPKVIYVSRPIPPPQTEMNNFDSDSSDISDIDFMSINREPLRHYDPFPIDEELNKRISSLLGEAGKETSIQPLGDIPKYTRIKSPATNATATTAKTNAHLSITPPTNLHVSPQGKYRNEQSTYVREERMHVVQEEQEMEVNKAKLVGDSFDGPDSDSGFPDFQPHIVPMKRNNIVSVQPQNQKPQTTQPIRNKVVLREISPNDSQEEDF